MHASSGVRIAVRLAGVAVLASLLSGCLFTQMGPTAGPAPLRYRDDVFSDITVSHDIQYGTNPDTDNQPVALKLDLYEPTGDTAPLRPAIVEVHGGSFSGGDKADEGPVVEPLVHTGFVAVSINYRLWPSGTCNANTIATACTAAALAGITDAQAAVRWLRANATQYRIDPTRIAIEGVSAGAIIATGVGATSDLATGAGGNPGYSSKVKAWVSVSGGLPGGEFVGAGDPPGYLFSGTADTTVPYQWSVDTANALSNAGGYAVLYTEPGVGHTMPDLTLLATQTAAFYSFVMNLKSLPQ
jgi:predicted esterase